MDDAEAPRDPTRGVLFPARLPTMHRIPPDDEIAWMVRWFWVPEWDLAPGRTSRQTLLPYPACNLVVEQHGAGIAGPTTRRSDRDLTGRGWAVGALLRPAATPLVPHDLSTIRDEYRPFDAPALLATVVAAMEGVEPAVPGEATPGDGSRRERAVAAFTDWLRGRGVEPTDDARRANEMADLIETEPGIVHIADIADIAERMNMSPRTIQRLARRYVGLTPNVMIRRRRLQEAAETLRTDPSVTIADVAATLGYTDHAHLATEFREIVGFTPSAYRGEARD